jgi:hypothetical protein
MTSTSTTVLARCTTSTLSRAERMLISSIGRDCRHSKLQHHSKSIYGYKYLDVYRLTLACEYEGTLHLRTRVRVYRVYSIYRVRVYPTLEQLARANTPQVKCSSGRSCQRNPRPRTTISRPSRDTAIKQLDNMGTCF